MRMRQPFFVRSPQIWASFASLIMASLLPSAASAQLSSDEDAPIDITGDTAEFQDNKAIWKGNVRVRQGESLLTSKTLTANLNDDGEIVTIIAIGDVKYSNGSEAITGERGRYDEASRTITIYDNVVVTQGRQVMAAGAVTYWIDTGRVQFAPAEGERVRGIFYTKDVEGQS